MLTVNYFKNRSSNQLIPYVLSSITGFSSVTRNFPAVVENTGWEFSLNTINIQHKSFSWTSSFNITIPKNKLVDFPGLASSSYASSLVIGESINANKYFSFAGVDKETGLYQYHDSKGMLVPYPSYPEDATVLLDQNPKFYGGLQNNVSYKNFELTFLFQFTKQQAANFRFGTAYLAGTNLNMPVEVLNRWQKPGDQAEYQMFSRNAYLYDVKGSDHAFADASYIRLKNLSLSWNMPERWSKNVKLEHVRLFAQGQNLLTFTNYLGLDPENASFENLPPLRVITFGAQITL